MTAAKAAPEWIPKTATATAIANSKLLLAAVKESVAVFEVVRSELMSHPERNEKHDDEIDQERNGDPQHIERQSDDEITF